MATTPPTLARPSPNSASLSDPVSNIPTEYESTEHNYSQQIQTPSSVLSISTPIYDNRGDCPQGVAEYETTTNIREGRDPYHPQLSSRGVASPSEHITRCDTLEVSSLPDTRAAPAMDTSAGFSSTELPVIRQVSHRQQGAPLVQDPVVPAFNSNTDCLHPSILNLGGTFVCEPRESAQPHPRRGRRERQRRRRRRRHRSRRHHRSTNHADDDAYVKPDCCSVLACRICLASCMEFKKVLVFFASSGIICVLIGIVLGVLKSPGNSFFALALSFVALGVVLLIMVLIGWRCVPSSQQPCHRLFNLGNFCSRTRRNRRRRQRQSWFGRRMNPEFRYRPPPPSYASAMQDQRNQLRHLALESLSYMPGSPPPSYKSHTTIERPGIHIIFPRNDEFPTSNPPTYRLRNSPERPSLTSLDMSDVTTDNQEPSTRFSVSSTTALVDAEQQIEFEPAEGVVNMSFSMPDHTVDMSSLGQGRHCQNTSGHNGRPTITSDESAHSNIFRNIPHSIAIILENDDSSTL